ncbi:NAD-dependent epimerase/dehydratase family protein [Candidatus Dependentiae bacterium]|nr:NAD-dependent epimerase/dehydratase family protein [Candidatus Dependentiae bacterium]
MKKLYNYYAGKNILVTGGAGFIGSSVVEKLVEYNAQVTVLDNFSTGSIENLSSCAKKITIISGDLTNPETCLITATNKSHIFHLAAKTSVQESIEQPDLYELNNLIGTKNILNAAKICGVKRFVFSSSAAVYGDQKNRCQETMPLNPLSPYAETKRLGERLCIDFYKKNQFIPVILRYFNVDGSAQNKLSNYSAVIPIFIEKIKKRLPITLFGDGMQTRDFVSLEDVVNANLLAGACPFTQPEIINVGTGNSITLLELVRKLQKRFEFPEQTITFLPARAGDIIKSEADCTKFFALKQWGFEEK